jgi:hypothetical protein
MRTLRNRGVFLMLSAALACGRSPEDGVTVKNSVDEAPAQVAPTPEVEIPEPGDTTGAAQSIDCAESDTRPTVFIRDCDTTVANVAVGECRAADHFRACVDGPSDDFPRCVAKASNLLKELGAITGPDKGKIQKCAAIDEEPGTP